MEDSLVNNRRIAKNTILLYFRMFVTLAVTLYTSRVILKVLGVEDFGTYNIIGGVVVLFVFINTGLRNASQRFISYEIGIRGKQDKVFSISIECMVLMALIFVLLSESIGLWFVHNKLNIPIERIYAAEWVYQFSIATFVVNMLQSPYYAAIISHEKMSFYAYISIFDVVLKLLVVYLLLLGNFDKLILYSFLLFIVAVIHLLILLVYTKKKLLLYFSLSLDKTYFKKILGFSGWTMLNGGSVAVAYQGGNILLNMFFGVAANAAFGIANQVSNAVYGFVGNFQGAFQPQIVKLYAAGLKDELTRLINRSSIISYYLLFIIFVPLTININYILSLWLGVVPDYAANFCILLLLYFLLDALQAPLWMLIGATGEMKVYTIWSALITFLNLPLAWLLLNNGASIYSVFLIRVVLNFICCIIRPFYVKHLVKDFSVIDYVREVVFRVMFVTAICAIALFVLIKVVGYDNLTNILLCIIICFTVSYLFGFNKEDKKVLNGFVKEKLHI